MNQAPSSPLKIDPAPRPDPRAAQPTLREKLLRQQAEATRLQAAAPRPPCCRGRQISR